MILLGQGSAIGNHIQMTQRPRLPCRLPQWTACLDDAVRVARGVQSLRWCFGLSANHISGTQAFCCHREGSVPLVNIPETLRFEFRG